MHRSGPTVALATVYHHHHRRGRRGSPAGSEAGFTLIEVLVANVILALAILGFVHCILVGNKVNRATEERALAVVSLGRFMERMRADTSWKDLYDRLRPLSSESANDPGLASLAVDTSLRTWPVTDYYPDLGVPPSLGTVRFLVQVPTTGFLGVPSLVESVDAPRYGLPNDLNGDGLIDSNPRDGDYTALPVVVRLRWGRPSEKPKEVVLATWLRGER